MGPWLFLLGLAGAEGESLRGEFPLDLGQIFTADTEPAEGVRAHIAERIQVAHAGTLEALQSVRRQM